MKRTSILIVLMAVFVCGCELPGPLQRLGNVTDHCQLVRGETGWANFSYQCFFEDNPLDSAPLQIP